MYNCIVHIIYNILYYVLFPICGKSICIILLLRQKYSAPLYNQRNWCQPPLPTARRPSRSNGGTPVPAPMVALPFRRLLTSVRPTPAPPRLWGWNGPTLAPSRTGVPPLAPEQECHHCLLRGRGLREVVAGTNFVGAARIHIIRFGEAK